MSNIQDTMVIDSKSDRILEMLPGIFAWSIILTPVVGGLFFPKFVAYGIFFFLIYWFIKSFKSAFYSILGYILVQEWKKFNWHEKWLNADGPKLEWEKIKHVVLIPNFNETEEKLAKTVASFAKQRQIDRKQMFVVLAMEERAEGARARAVNLIARFKDDFGGDVCNISPGWFSR